MRRVGFPAQLYFVFRVGYKFISMLSSSWALVVWAVRLCDYLVLGLVVWAVRQVLRWGSTTYFNTIDNVCLSDELPNSMLFFF